MPLLKIHYDGGLRGGLGDNEPCPPRRRPLTVSVGHALPERGGNRRAVRRRGARRPWRARGSTARSSWPTTARRTARASSPGAPGRASSPSPLAATAPRSRAASRRRAAATSSWATRISRMTSAPYRTSSRRSTRAPTSSWARACAAGSRKGAMPPLHRWLGNPVLTGLGRLFFRTDVSDFHCGLRAFRRDALLGLDLRTTGMEYASEMVVKAALFGLQIAEIPVRLRPDGRSRPPHLRTWRDGWRHLRFLLLYSPRWLFLVPGLALALAGGRPHRVAAARPARVRPGHARRPHDARRSRRWSSSARPRSSPASARRSSASPKAFCRRTPFSTASSTAGSRWRPVSSPGRRASSGAAFSWAAS